MFLKLKNPDSFYLRRSSTYYDRHLFVGMKNLFGTCRQTYLVTPPDRKTCPCTNHSVDITHFVPPLFTTPTTVAAAYIHALILSDFKHNPLLVIIGHGQYNPLFSSNSCSSPNSGLWGGDIG
jgi:hypothetical protein